MCLTETIFASQGLHLPPSEHRRSGKVDRDSEAARGSCGITAETVGTGGGACNRASPSRPPVLRHFPPGWGNLCFQAGHAPESIPAVLSTDKAVQAQFPGMVSVLEHTHFSKRQIKNSIGNIAAWPGFKTRQMKAGRERKEGEGGRGKGTKWAHSDRSLALY